MMKILNQTGTILIVLILFSGCDKNDVEKFNLKGTIKGTISTCNEFGREIDDNNGIYLVLEGSEPLIYTMTDREGKFEIQDIPTAPMTLSYQKRVMALIVYREQ